MGLGVVLLPMMLFFFGYMSKFEDFGYVDGLGFCVCCRDFLVVSGMVRIWGRELLLLGQKCLRFLLGVLVCVLF